MTASAGASAPPLRVSRRLPARPEDVYRAWTEPERIRRWMSPGSAQLVAAECDVRVGGRFHLLMRDRGVDYEHTGEYRALRPPEGLEFTWVSKGTHERETLVTVELREAGDATDLVLVHTRLPDAEAVARHRGGWEGIVRKLEQHVTAGGAR
jgi:uncharacterized protein YndB with AHSA1/START domain